MKFQPPKQVDGTVPERGYAAMHRSQPPTGEHFGTATAAVRIPAWWLLLLHTCHPESPTHVIESLPAYSDIRETKLLLSSRNIEDPALGAEYRDFYLGCFRPAKRNYEILRQQGLVAASPAMTPSWTGQEAPT